MLGSSFQTTTSSNTNVWDSLRAHIQKTLGGSYYILRTNDQGLPIVQVVVLVPKNDLSRHLVTVDVLNCNNRYGSLQHAKSVRRTELQYRLLVARQKSRIGK